MAYHIDEDDVIVAADGQVRGASEFIESRNRLFGGAFAHREPAPCYGVGSNGERLARGVGIKAMGKLWVRRIKRCCEIVFAVYWLGCQLAHAR